jgi:hypothetical protein
MKITVKWHYGTELNRVNNLAIDSCDYTDSSNEADGNGKHERMEAAVADPDQPPSSGGL